METRDLYALAAYSFLIAGVAAGAGYAVDVTTHSDLLLGLTMLVLIGGPSAAVLRWSHRLNRRAGSVPAAATPEAIVRMVAGLVLIVAAFAGTYVAYAVSHDRWFEGATAVALAVANVAFQMSAATRLPPLKPHEIGQVRLSMYLFLLLPLLLASTLALWLTGPGETSWPAMREANVAADFVLILLMPAISFVQRRRYLEAKNLTSPTG